jgi:hypothetical protein
MFRREREAQHSGDMNRQQDGCGREAGLTHLIASALRRCESIARSRRLRKEQGGFAAAANPKDMSLEHIEIKREEI